MFEQNSNLNNQQFSKEVLEYFKSIETPDNKEWIEKYFEVLADPLNKNSEKFRKHHIIPCFTFKDKTHQNRKEVLYLANNYPQNIIKISIYNHIKAHYYLIKIFNNKDAKIAFQHMFGKENYKNNLTETEVNTLAYMIEECARKNKTKEEIRLYMKQYDNNRKEKKREYDKQRYYNNKEKIKEYHKYYLTTHEKELKEYYKNNKEQICIKKRKRDSQKCYDPIKGDYLNYGALQSRKERNKVLYKTVILQDCILKKF